MNLLCSNFDSAAFCSFVSSTSFFFFSPPSVSSSSNPKSSSSSSSSPMTASFTMSRMGVSNNSSSKLCKKLAYIIYGPNEMLEISIPSSQPAFFLAFSIKLFSVNNSAGVLLLPLMTMLSHIVCVFPFTPETSSAGSGAVKAKKGRAKLTKAFRWTFSGTPFNNLTSSRQDKADTRPVVVIMAGTILPATLRVSIGSAGAIPYERARKLLAAVTNATCPFDSSSFSKSAKFKRGRNDAPVLAPFNLSKITDAVSLSPPPDKLCNICFDFRCLASSVACTCSAAKASSNDISDGASSPDTERKDSILSLVAADTNSAILSLIMTCWADTSSSSESSGINLSGFGGRLVPDQNGCPSSSKLSTGCFWMSSSIDVKNRLYARSIAQFKDALFTASTYSGSLGSSLPTTKG